MSAGDKDQTVYTLVVQVGRKTGDGLPKGASGAGLLCYAAAADEAEAVRETVSVLEVAGLAPLDVTAYGTLAEREAGDGVAEDERLLIAQALCEDAVVVAEVTPFFGEP
ncbi:MAG: hypothetical protein AAGG56_13285 [Pseudomonadota bacterium]